MNNNKPAKPSLHTILSPSLLPLYELTGKTVVIIDVLRATSTIATALHNGAKEIIPVNDVMECIRLSSQLDAISAGERNGKIADGLKYGNSPLIFTSGIVTSKTIVLTTTNGTRLLHEALAADAGEILTGAFVNLSSVSSFLAENDRDVILACSAWKNRVNIEDTLFAGALINEVKDHFQINCDSSAIAESLYIEGKDNLLEFMKQKNASHYQRLLGYGHEDDLKYCFKRDVADVLAVYRDGRLVVFSNK